MVLSADYIIQTLKHNILNKATYENYINRLNKLALILKTSIYDIIKTPNIANIQKAYPNSISTQKNIVTVILSVFKNIPELAEKKPIAQDKWKKIHEILRNKENEIPTKIAPITKEQLNQKYLEYKNFDPHFSLQRSQEYLLLSIAIHSPNQLILFAKRPTTGKLTVPTTLADDIITSVKKHPRQFIFVNNQKESFINNNSFTVYVGRVFKKIFGETIGINTLKLI